jgi:isopentenyl-diphosphate Delta-isomerase
MIIDRSKVVLVDENDNVIGLKEKFATHKNPVPLHRAISIVIYSPDRKSMLLQKRSTKKPTWPLYWSNTVCSHPYPEESYADAAKRRLVEEMGFTTTLKELYRMIYDAIMDEKWGEHELDVVFEGVYDGPVNPNPDEAADFKWLTIEELKKDLVANPGIYTPWFKMMVKKMQLL